MGFITNTERTASLLAKTDVSIIKVNVSTFDSADEGTQLRLLKVFVETVTERLKQTTSILNQLRKI
jgi:CRP-like cAMP-binding protein